MDSAQLQLFARIEDVHWWFVARRQIIAPLVARLVPPHQNKKIVDIGCGTGGNLGTFTAGYRCVGVDASPVAIALAAQRFPAARFIADSNPLDVANEVAGADLVMLMDVIEHVPDDFLFFSTVAAAMKPGTQVLLTVPADPSLWSPHDEAVLHMRRYERARFEAVWAGLPFRVRMVSHFNSRLRPGIKLARTVARWRARSVGKDGTDFHAPPEWLNSLLTNVFAGEAGRLLPMLDGGRGYERGVSVIAVLERQPGDIEPRTRPAGVPADRRQYHRA